jgi:hypothetical protein
VSLSSNPNTAKKKERKILYNLTLSEGKKNNNMRLPRSKDVVFGRR